MQFAYVPHANRAPFTSSTLSQRHVGVNEQGKPLYTILSYNSIDKRTLANIKNAGGDYLGDYRIMNAFCLNLKGGNTTEPTEEERLEELKTKYANAIKDVADLAFELAEHGIDPDTIAPYAIVEPPVIPVTLPPAGTYEIKEVV